MIDNDLGLYEKFRVRRTDCRDAVGEKHYGCNYFVLDMTHDAHAIPAIEAYAVACRESCPDLARDLMLWARPARRAIEQAGEKE